MGKAVLGSSCLIAGAEIVYMTNIDKDALRMRNSRRLSCSILCRFPIAIGLECDRVVSH